jgi:hypothetical protein
MVNEPKELQHLLKQSNIRVLTFGCNIMAGAVLAGTVTALVGCEFLFRLKDKIRKSNS